MKEIKVSDKDKSRLTGTTENL